MNPAALLACVAALAALCLGAGAFVLLHTAVYAATVGAAGVGLFVFSLRRDYRRDMAERALALVILMPLLAWILPHILLLYLAMCFWVPLMAGRRDCVAGVYLFSLMLLPGLDLPMALGPLKLCDFGVHDGLALGAAFAVSRQPVQHPGQFRADKWAGALMLLFAVVLSRETSATNLLRTAVNVVFDLGLPYYVLSRGQANMTDVRTTLRWFACGGMALAALMIFEAVRSWSLYNELYPHFGLPIMFYMKARGGILRAAGPFMEPTSAALVLTICLAALWLLRRDFRTPLRHTILAGIMFVGMSVPQSRGAWMGAICGLVLIDIYKRDYIVLARRGLVVAGLVVTVLAGAMVSSSVARTVGLSAGPGDTVEYRSQLFHRGMEQILQRPLTGYSSQQLSVVMADMRQGEGIIDFVNSFIWVALISGIGGFALFVGNFVAPMVRVWKLRAGWLAQGEAGIDGLEAGAFLFTSLAMLMVMFAFTSFGMRPAYVTFALFGFAGALVGVERARRAVLSAAMLAIDDMQGRAVPA